MNIIINKFLYRHVTYIFYVINYNILQALQKYVKFGKKDTINEKRH